MKERNFITFPETIIDDRHRRVLEQLDSWHRKIRLSQPGQVQAEVFFDVLRTHLEIDAEESAYDGSSGKPHRMTLQG
jgi:hypothetical protein